WKPRTSISTTAPALMQFVGRTRASIEGGTSVHWSTTGGGVGVGGGGGGGGGVGPVRVSLPRSPSSTPCAPWSSKRARWNHCVTTVSPDEFVSIAGSLIG